LSKKRRLNVIIKKNITCVDFNNNKKKNNNNNNNNNNNKKLYYEFKK
jgi:hypothetical protein